MQSNTERCLALAEDVEAFPLGKCGPSDDPDKQTTFLYAFRDLAKRFVAMARRLGDLTINASLDAIDTSPERIEAAYDLRAELVGIIDAIRDNVHHQQTREGMQDSLAKLRGLRKVVGSFLVDKRAGYFDPGHVVELFGRYSSIAEQLQRESPGTFGDLPKRQAPEPSKTTDYDGRGYILRTELERLARDIDYIVEVSSHTGAGRPPEKVSHRVFLSHGRANDWREVQAYIEKDLGLPTLELAQEPNQGRTVLQKLDEHSQQCSYAVVVMTGDDQTQDGKPRARENVMHEIGFFQARYGLARVCLLYEDGTSIPTNIGGLVYASFPKGVVKASFPELARELRAAFP